MGADAVRPRAEQPGFRSRHQPDRACGGLLLRGGDHGGGAKRLCMQEAALSGGAGAGSGDLPGGYRQGEGGQHRYYAGAQARGLQGSERACALFVKEEAAYGKFQHWRRL